MIIPLLTSAVILDSLVKASREQRASGFPEPIQIGILLKAARGEAVRINLSERATGSAPGAAIDNDLLHRAVRRTVRIGDIGLVVIGALMQRGLYREGALLRANRPIRHLVVQPGRTRTIDDATVGDVRSAVSIHLEGDLNRTALTYRGRLSSNGTSAAHRLYRNGFLAERLSLLIQGSNRDGQRPGITKGRARDSIRSTRDLLVVYKHLTDSQILHIDLVILRAGDGRPAQPETGIGTNRGAGSGAKGELRRSAGGQRHGQDAHEREYDEEQRDKTLHRSFSFQDQSLKIRWEGQLPDQKEHHKVRRESLPWNSSPFKEVCLQTLSSRFQEAD